MMVPLTPLVDPLPLSGDDLPEAAFTAILALLHKRRQFDLQSYKDRCLRRRIAKCLRSSGAGDIDSYLARLAADDAELDLLLATLSVHVSSFFRDPEVFRILERQILPGLCAQLCAEGRSELRLWSAGCAGGEEAYSLAMLADVLIPPGLQTRILATDVSEPVLDRAREGRYSAAHLSNVPEPLRASCFHSENEQYTLSPRIRAMVHFQRHDLLTAGSYPPADLIFCRNVLMYFNQEQQLDMLARFAAALPVGGVLVLGRTESLPRTATAPFREDFPAERIFLRLAESNA
jgi:chemotaxis protein methyltransferase CheR